MNNERGNHHAAIALLTSEGFDIVGRTRLPLGNDVTCTVTCICQFDWLKRDAPYQFKYTSHLKVPNNTFFNYISHTFFYDNEI